MSHRTSKVKKTVRATRARFNALVELSKLATATIEFGMGNQVIRCFPSSMTPANIRRACKRHYNEVKRITLERSGVEPMVLT